MFSKNKPVLQFMIDSLEGNVHECRRKNVVSFRNRLVKYPFENALAALPLEDNLACLKGYVYNPYKARFPSRPTCANGAGHLWRRHLRALPSFL